MVNFDVNYCHLTQVSEKYRSHHGTITEMRGSILRYDNTHLHINIERKIVFHLKILTFAAANRVVPICLSLCFSFGGPT